MSRRGWDAAPKDFTAPTIESVLRNPIVERTLIIIGILKGRWREEGDYPGAWDQFCRALESVALNVAEGFGRPNGQRAFFFGVARGSAYEAAVAVRVLELEVDVIQNIDVLARECDALMMGIAETIEENLRKELEAKRIE